MSEHLPSRYRPVFEKINDLIFGKVQVIEIYGNNLISKDEVLTHIYRNDVMVDDLILINQSYKINKSLRNHTLISEVNIRRFLPNKMVIYIKEKNLVVKFYDKKKQRFLSVSEDGEILPFYDSSVKIPLLLGEYNPYTFFIFYKKLASYNEIIRVTTDIIPFWGFRYDIVLNRKMKISLPEENVDEALEELKKLITKNKILEKDIKHLDLRVKGKIFVEYFESGEVKTYRPNEKIITLQFN
jgi:cell division protein FtsQ